MQTKTPDSFCSLLFEVLQVGKIFKNQDFSQLLLNHLFRPEICSLRKHCKDYPDQFVCCGKYGFLRSQSFSLSLEEIGLKESILAHHRSGHQVDRPPKVPIASLG